MAKTKYEFSSIAGPEGSTSTSVTRISLNGHTVQGSWGNRGFGGPFTNTNDVVTKLSPNVVTLPNGLFGTQIQNSSGSEKVGSYFPSGGSPGGYYITIHGHTTYTPSDLRPSALSENGYIVAGNDSKQVVITPNGKQVPITQPEHDVNGISSNGTVIGNHYIFNADGTFSSHPFYETLGGPLVEIDPLPAIPYEIVNAINAAGQIVGTFHDTLGDHGFLYDTKTGEVDQIDVPGSKGTGLGAINDDGAIGGFYRIFDPNATDFGITGFDVARGFVAEVGHRSPIGTFLGESDVHVIVPPNI